MQQKPQGQSGGVFYLQQLMDRSTPEFGEKGLYRSVFSLNGASRYCRMGRG